MIFFTYSEVRCSVHVQQQHLNIIFGNSNRILVYWGVGTGKNSKNTKIDAKIDKITEKRHFPLDFFSKTFNCSILPIHQQITIIKNGLNWNFFIVKKLNSSPSFGWCESYVLFSQFSCEKRICFAPSKAVSGFFGWHDYSTIIICYFLKYFSSTLSKATLTMRTLPLRINMATMAPPPPPPIRNHANTWWELGDNRQKNIKG
jgi:hypothetical protein